MLKSSIKGIIAAGLTAVLATGAAPTGANAQEVKLPKQLLIATDREGGGSHTMGSAIAATLTKHVGTKAVVLPIGDPAKWVGMFRGKEIDFGLTSVTNLSWAYWGIQSYQGKPNQIYSLVALGAPSTWGFMIPADAPVNSPTELKSWLKGKRISHKWINPIIDHLNNAGLANIGFTGGVEEAGLIPVPVSSYKVFINLWVEGKVDIIGTPHVPLLAEMNAGRPAKFIAMNDDPASIARMQAVEKSYYVSTLKRDTFGAKAGMSFLTYDYSLVVRNDIEPGIIGKVLDTIAANQKELTDVHALLKGWFPPESTWATTNAPMPYHPEAVAYFKAKGWWSDALEAHQKGMVAQIQK